MKAIIRFIPAGDSPACLAIDLIQENESDLAMLQLIEHQELEPMSIFPDIALGEVSIYLSPLHIPEKAS